MIALIDDEATWLCVMKADRILGLLPAGQIAYLGDTFPWDVTEEDVGIARTHLIGARLHAIEIGRQLAQLAEEDAAALGDSAAPGDTTALSDSTALSDMA